MSARIELTRLLRHRLHVRSKTNSGLDRGFLMDVGPKQVAPVGRPNEEF